MTGLVKGHDFSRADKGNQINRALAPAKVGAQEITPGRTVSAASLALEKCPRRLCRRVGHPQPSHKNRLPRHFLLLERVSRRKSRSGSCLRPFIPAGQL